MKETPTRPKSMPDNWRYVYLVYLGHWEIKGGKLAHAYHPTSPDDDDKFQFHVPGHLVHKGAVLYAKAIKNTGRPGSVVSTWGLDGENGKLSSVSLEKGRFEGYIENKGLTVELQANHSGLELMRKAKKLETEQRLQSQIDIYLDPIRLAYQKAPPHIRAAILANIIQKITK